MSIDVFKGNFDGVWVYDSETDGLLNTLTKIHCVVFKQYNRFSVEYLPKESDKGATSSLTEWLIFCKAHKLSEQYVKILKNNYSISIYDTSLLPRFLRNQEVVKGLICHNQIGYDLPMLNKMLGVDYGIGAFDDPDMIMGRDITLLDTLVQSRFQNPERMLPKGCPATIKNPVTGKMDRIGAHGLLAWGVRTGIAKPEIHDWVDQPLHVYINRCIEDVKNNEATFKYLHREAEGLEVGGRMLGITYKDNEPYRLAQYGYHTWCERERTGVLFDQVAAQAVIDLADKWMGEIAERVNPMLPPRKAPKADQPVFPAKPFKKDGTISSTGNGWFNKWEGTEFFIPEEDQEGRAAALRRYQDDPEWAAKHVKWVPMLVSNQQDIKEYLAAEYGWKPTIWNSTNIVSDAFKRNLPLEKRIENAVRYLSRLKESTFKVGLCAEIEVEVEDVDAVTEEMLSLSVHEIISEHINEVPVGVFRGKHGSAAQKLKMTAYTDFGRLLAAILKAGRFAPSTPKFKEQVSGKLCDNLVALMEEHEHFKVDGYNIPKDIITYTSLANRRSIIQTAQEDGDTGWLLNPRLKEDGRLGASASNYAATYRLKHRVVVNVPKAEDSVILGKEMRSLFIAPEGYYNVGWDAAGLENRVAAHYAAFFDGGEYARDVLEGDVHTKNSNNYTKAAGFVVTRSKGKNVTYA